MTYRVLNILWHLMFAAEIIIGFATVGSIAMIATGAPSIGRADMLLHIPGILACGVIIMRWLADAIDELGSKIYGNYDK